MKKTLSSKGQPDAIHNWLKCHCNLDDMPDVTHFVDDFATQWEEWYMHLQPDWRLDTHSEDASGSGISLSQDPPEDAIISDWQDIKKGSQNGLFLLLLSLGWWGLGASDQGEDVLSWWACAFDDLRWVLEFLVSEENDNQESDKEGDEKDEGDGANSTVPAKCAISSDAHHPVSKRSVTTHHPIKFC